MEDPIEYNLPGIGRTQVNTKVDMTFARGLRAILRQDPGCGDDRRDSDLETAEIATSQFDRASSTFHAAHEQRSGAVTRLIDMGVEPFSHPSSLIGIVAQRLVRVLCTDCREAYHAG